MAVIIPIDLAPDLTAEEIAGSSVGRIYSVAGVNVDVRQTAAHRGE